MQAIPSKAAAVVVVANEPGADSIESGCMNWGARAMEIFRLCFPCPLSTTLGIIYAEQFALTMFNSCYTLERKTASNLFGSPVYIKIHQKS